MSSRHPPKEESGRANKNKMESKRSTRSKKPLSASDSDDDPATSLSAMNIQDGEQDDEPIPSTSNAARGTVALSQSRRAEGRKEIRKQFNTLIEKCQELEEKEGFDKTVEEMMTQNIGKGQQLFEEIGGGPGDMYLAFMHTRTCTSMLKYKTASIGSNTSAFKVTSFLSVLSEKYISVENIYDPREAIKCIASSASECCRTLNPMTVVIGAFEQKAPEKSKEKEKKQRAIVRRKPQDDETSMSQATHRELMTKMNANQPPQSEKNHESFSKEIFVVLKTNCRKTADRSMNLFEFILDKNSFAATIESLFHVAFLVRDGDVAFFRQDDQPNHDYTISIKPEARPVAESIQDSVGKKKKKSKKRVTSERSQFIVSFSVKQWKELCALSSGENIIADHKRRINTDEGDEETRVDELMDDE